MALASLAVIWRSSARPGRRRRWLHVLAHERREIAGARHQTARAVLRLGFMLPGLDPPVELVGSLVDGDLGLFAGADLDAAQTRVVERLGRDDDERGRLAAGEIDLALRPELGQVMPPGLLQPPEEE